MGFIFSFLTRSLALATMTFRHVTSFIGFGSAIDPKRIKFVQVFACDRLMFNTKIKKILPCFEFRPSVSCLVSIIVRSFSIHSSF